MAKKEMSDGRHSDWELQSRDRTNRALTGDSWVHHVRALHARLAKTAKYTFGNWAVQGLRLAATWAENTGNFLQVSCYKVLVMDPHDAVIPDFSALRTAVALDFVTNRLPPSDRLPLLPPVNKLR